jgi:uncharacterized membrane protein
MPSELVVFAFDGQFTAEQVYENFEQLEKEELLVIEDAVIAFRGPKTDKQLSGIAPADETGIDPMVSSVSLSSQEVTIKQTRQKRSKHTLRGGGVGLLAGLLLGGPIIGLAAGAAVGGIVGLLKDYGIEDSFVRDLSQPLEPDSSALFIMGEVKDEDELISWLQPLQTTIIQTTLSPEQERQLKNKLEGH